jgi:hypothetical protein
MNIINELVDKDDLNNKLLPYLEKNLKLKLKYFDKGSRGIVFTNFTDPEWLYKITDDATEYYTAKKIQSTPLKHVINIDKVTILKSNYFNRIMRPMGDTWSESDINEYYFLKIERVKKDETSDALLNDTYNIFRRALSDMKVTTDDFRRNLLGNTLSKMDLYMHKENFRYFCKNLGKNYSDLYYGIIEQYIELISELAKNKIITLDFNLKEGLNLGFRGKTLVLLDVGHSSADGVGIDYKDILNLD